MKLASKILAVALCVLGVLGLVGWGLEIEIFKRLNSSMVSINPVVSAWFSLLGVACFFQVHFPKTSRKFRIFLLLSIVTVGVGSSRIFALVTGIDLHLDTLFFAEAMANDLINGLPNRMAPNTAFNMTTLGVSLFLYSIPRRETRSFCNYLTLIALLVGMFSAVGYVYGVKEFYGFLQYIPMALYTSIGFLLAVGTLLLLNSKGGFMATFSSPQLGGRIARLMLPSVVIVPVLFGFFRLELTRVFPISLELGVGTLITCIIATFFVLVWYLSVVLNISDGQRNTAVGKLNKLNKELEINNISLNSRTEELSLANRELESFSYSISHDLRAPLRSINGFSQILLEEYALSLDEEGKRIAGNIASNAKKMSLLIDDLLSFAQMGRKEMIRNQVSMKEICESVVRDLKSEDETRQVKVQIQDLPTMMADPVLMKQVWVNLISNAFKYTRNTETPEIQIGYFEGETGTVYYIKDNGAGFDMQYYPKLFGVFQRLHSPKDFDGTGVGLAIVNRIITRHGGRVWAEGKEGEGASFFFTLSATS